MRAFFTFFLLSTSILAQTEQAEQQVTKLRVLLQAQEQFLVPLNQSLSAVAEENGYTIDESYTYVDGTEPYDHFFKGRLKGNLWPKISFAGAFIAAPLVVTVGSFLKRRVSFFPLALFLAAVPAIPYEVNAFVADSYYINNRIYIAPDCVDSFATCVAGKLESRPPYHIAELHYKLTPSGFKGSCFVMFAPDNYSAPSMEGYESVLTDPLLPFRESTKINFDIAACTHQGAFPSLVTIPEGGNVVATGSIFRESIQ